MLGERQEMDPSAVVAIIDYFDLRSLAAGPFARMIRSRLAPAFLPDLAAALAG
jgi:hypothetical protein